MNRGHLHQTLSPPGTFEFLKIMDGSTAAHPMQELLSMMAEAGVENPVQTLDDLASTSVVQQLGERFALSASGIRAFVLLEALNGGDIRTAYERLSGLDSTLRTYELVREGMTSRFLEEVNARPDFARLYICSPWISFDERSRRLLVHAVHAAETKGERPELLVLTRPDGDGGVPRGVTPLVDLGAVVFLNSRLHTKLYVREAGRRGGYALAVVGSQNLTRSRYLELGVRIRSDTTMIDQLISYFLELTHKSTEIQTEEGSGKGDS